MVLTERIEQALIESLERQEVVLASLRNMLWKQIHMTETLSQEYGSTTKQNSLTWLASSSGNIIIRTLYIFIDPNIGGTYTLQLGTISFAKSCPVSGIDIYPNAAFIVKQNAPRSITIVPPTGTAAYISVVAFGEKAGDAGWMA